jgi:hypothetical protein
MPFAAVIVIWAISDKAQKVVLQKRCATNFANGYFYSKTVIHATIVPPISLTVISHSPTVKCYIHFIMQFTNILNNKKYQNYTNIQP